MLSNFFARTLYYPAEVRNRKDVEQTRPDTIVQGKAKRSGNDSIMRGFDPASEDDMTDNGMSRYMENNDDEGWE
jgi:hypothetical protein